MLNSIGDFLIRRFKGPPNTQLIDTPYLYRYKSKIMEKNDLFITASLARLELEEDEAQKLGEEVSRILTYFEKMSEVDVDGLEPTTHALQKENRLREDRRRPNEAQPDELLECAPDLEDRFILIPNVL